MSDPVQQTARELACRGIAAGALIVTASEGVLDVIDELPLELHGECVVSPGLELLELLCRCVSPLQEMGWWASELAEDANWSGELDPPPRGDPLLCVERLDREVREIERLSGALASAVASGEDEQFGERVARIAGAVRETRRVVVAAREAADRVLGPLFATNGGCA